MTALQAFLLGIVVALSPSLLLLASVLLRELREWKARKVAASDGRNAATPSVAPGMRAQGRT